MIDQHFTVRSACRNRNVGGVCCLMWLYWMSSSNYSKEESYLPYLSIRRCLKKCLLRRLATQGDILGPDDMLDVQRTYVQALKTN